MPALPSFFFTDPAPTEISTLSLHDALPIYTARGFRNGHDAHCPPPVTCEASNTNAPAGATRWLRRDRKSTRLNSSHVSISYAVFCLKKKKTMTHDLPILPSTAHLLRKYLPP